MPEFPKAEYDSRVKRLGKLMQRDKLDLVLVSGDENFRYFTGARSLASWRSYTRPVFAILDGENPPVALVHASLEETTRAEGYYSEVHAYQDITKSPIKQLSALLGKRSKKEGAKRVGFEGSHEQRIGLPFLDFSQLVGSPGFKFVDATDAIWELRRVKSQDEVEAATRSGLALSRARERCFSEIKAGMTEREVARCLGSNVLEEGADEVAFVHVNAGKLHTWYPTDRKLQPGEVVYIDAGAMVKGYCCEFDRIGTVGPASQAQRDLHALILDINESMRKKMSKGVKCSEVFAECNRKYAEAKLPTEKWGRAGHGQGLLATELPSVAAHDQTVLVPGSVVSTEPGIINETGVFVWEDVYAIREYGATLLSVESKDLHQISA
jgi:Xaa-Pro dipeptidase